MSLRKCSGTKSVKKKQQQYDRAAQIKIKKLLFFIYPVRFNVSVHPCLQMQLALSLNGEFKSVA